MEGGNPLGAPHRRHSASSSPFASPSPSSSAVVFAHAQPQYGGDGGAELQQSAFVASAPAAQQQPQHFVGDAAAAKEAFCEAPIVWSFENFMEELSNELHMQPDNPLIQRTRDKLQENGIITEALVDKLDQNMVVQALGLPLCVWLGLSTLRTQTERQKHTQGKRKRTDSSASSSSSDAASKAEKMRRKRSKKNPSLAETRAKIAQYLKNIKHEPGYIICRTAETVECTLCNSTFKLHGPGQLARLDRHIRGTQGKGTSSRHLLNLLCARNQEKSVLGAGGARTSPKKRKTELSAQAATLLSDLTPPPIELPIPPQFSDPAPSTPSSSSSSSSSTATSPAILSFSHSGILSSPTSLSNTNNTTIVERRKSLTKLDKALDLLEERRKELEATTALKHCHCLVPALCIGRKAIPTTISSSSSVREEVENADGNRDGATNDADEGESVMVVTVYWVCGNESPTERCDYVWAETLLEENHEQHQHHHNEGETTSTSTTTEGVNSGGVEVAIEDVGFQQDTSSTTLSRTGREQRGRVNVGQE
ncbi:hypothetical protein QOT17_005178 [Balamuthia mandrillaris]